MSADYDFNKKRRFYYKAGDICYELSSKTKYVKDSAKRRHTVFLGWTGYLNQLYKEEQR